MLSILRIMVGVLYMEHGLAKILGFSRTIRPYALFTLVPGPQGLLELVGGLLLALDLFTRTVALVPAGKWGGRLFHGACAERFLAGSLRGADCRVRHPSARSCLVAARFVPDSPLEGEGFEPLAPPGITRLR
jgi:hypothetical protein